MPTTRCGWLASRRAAPEGYLAGSPRSTGGRVPSSRASVRSTPAGTPPPSSRRSPSQRAGHPHGRGSRPRDDAGPRPGEWRDDRRVAFATRSVNTATSRPLWQHVPALIPEWFARHDPPHVRHSSDRVWCPQPTSISRRTAGCAGQVALSAACSRSAAGTGIVASVPSGHRSTSAVRAPDSQSVRCHA